jgi:sRNA-binding carbon storage regulator CsrA
VRSPKSKSPREGNLVLGLKKDTAINLDTSDGLVTVKIHHVKRHEVWLTFNAPKAVQIVRSEIDGRKAEADQ